MSNRAITWAYEQAAGSVGAKAVLVALADKVDGDHQWRIKQDTLAQMTEQSVRAVRGHLAELERRGLIARTKNYADGRRKADTYTLPVAVMVAVHKAAEPAASAASKPARAAGKRRTVPADTVETNRQNLPGVNPQDQPSQAKDVVRATRGTRLPDDWLRSDDDKKWQADHGIPDEFAREATASFRDHFKAAPGQKGVKLDWSATWRNWMRRDWRGRDGETYRRTHGSPPRVVDFDAERTKAKLERERARFASPSHAVGIR